MITANVIQRTFQIKFGDSLGTAFTIDHEGKQYLITARHVVDGIKSGDNLKITFTGPGDHTSVEVVGMGEGEADVAVLSCSLQLSPPFLLPASHGGIAYGQTVYFLGFPYGWDGGNSKINRGFPIPIVKPGILSTLPEESSPRFNIGGHVNRGFSGGPVVFRPSENLSASFCVAGIVSGLPIVKELVYNEEGKEAGYYLENPGFVQAIKIGHAIELIEANPIGFELPEDQV